MKAVLIVEDDSFFAQEIREFLSDNGVEGVVVQSATEAVQIDLERFSAAIIDVMVPNDPAASGISLEESRGGFSTGVAVARRLRKKASTLPILLFSGATVNVEAENWAENNSARFAMKGDGLRPVTSFLREVGALGKPIPPRAFIVHGHDDQALLETKNYIQNTLNWQEPVILREQPSGGKTIIEKFEDLSGKIDYVFVLMTPDDKVASSAGNEEKRRSRQNVIFELGFFYGKLRRKSARVFVLHKGGVELPSDIQGIIWIDITNGVAAAGGEIRRELSQ